MEKEGDVRDREEKRRVIEFVSYRLCDKISKGNRCGLQLFQ